MLRFTTPSINYSLWGLDDVSVWISSSAILLNIIGSAVSNGRKAPRVFLTWLQSLTFSRQKGSRWLGQGDHHRLWNSSQKTAFWLIWAGTLVQAAEECMRASGESFFSHHCLSNIFKALLLPEAMRFSCVMICLSVSLEDNCWSVSPLHYLVPPLV